MYKDVLRSIDDVSLFPVIAFVAFFIFFIMLFVYVIKIDKKEVNHMAAIPLDDPTAFETLSPNGKAHNYDSKSI
ncbi:MAG: cbb3-type cytochrome c oxidase subunit 3 [Bacteroidetes bacterium]|nr:MAG: cbb3-type cytochrome c oxidase subunit 3 [Bacteroidota bacterium]